jgi:hypothetical protein
MKEGIWTEEALLKKKEAASAIAYLSTGAILMTPKT